MPDTTERADLIGLTLTHSLLRIDLSGLTTRYGTVTALPDLTTHTTTGRMMRAAVRRGTR